MKNMKNWLFWFFLLFFYFISRLALIDRIPPGVSNDEADNGYEAYSLLKTGRDQWGVVWPVTDFLGFGDHRLPIYIYLTIPSVALAGLNSASIRFPAIIFGAGIVILSYALVRSWFSDRVGKLAAIVLTLMPWFWGMTRVAIEPPIALFFILAGTLILWNARNRIHFYLLSAILFILAMFSYPGIRLFVPIWTAYLTIVRLSGKTRMVFGLGAVIVTAGIFWGSSSTRLKQIWVFENPVLLDVANRHIDGCRDVVPLIVCRVLENKKVVIMEEITKNYLSHFSLNFIFLETDLANGLLPMGGLAQKSLLLPVIVGAILILSGVIFNDRFKNKISVNSVLVWLLVAPLADSLTGTGHYSRSFVMVFPLAIAAGLGFELIWQKWRKICLVIVAIYIIESGKFALDYFSYFPKYHARYTHYEYKELMDYLKGMGETEYSNIYISNKYFDTKQYMFYLYYFEVDPSWYQKAENKDWHTEDNGWIRITRVGRWQFVSSLPDVNDVPDSSLYIGSREEVGSLIAEGGFTGDICLPKVELMKTFRFPDGGDSFWVIRVREIDCGVSPE